MCLPIRNSGLRLGGDSLRLGQILTNLAGNAIKFTDSGEIVVRTELLEEGSDDLLLQFSVQDTGIGLNAEQMDNLFKEFSQADAATSRKYGGTGLGLAISKRLVEMMDGQINVTSEIGKGSCFTFSARFDKVADQGIAALVPAEDMRDLHILVVEDNDNARKITTGMLNAFNYQPVCVENGENALEALIKADKDGSPFDLVLMDWKMPGMDGLQTTQKIITNSPLGKVPKVIMVTAYARDDVVPAKIRQEFLDGFLMKPINETALMDAIMSAFGHCPSGRFLESEEIDLASSLAGAKLLLVEDNEINQQVAQELLQQVQIQVVIANNGQEAVELVFKESFDGILMDLQMPVMDGFQATKQIRQGKSADELPIIAMTANAMAGDRERCLEAGMNDHVGKPVVPKDLYVTLSKWIEKKAEDSPPQPVVAASSKNICIPLPIPQLPGINVTMGLRNVGGNTTLYRNVLLRFSHNQGGASQQIEQFLTVGDAEALEHTAHALKGVSSTIGANKLSGLAGAVEKVAQSQEGLEELPELLAEMNNELMRIVSTIETTLALDEFDKIQPRQAEIDAELEVLEPLFQKAVAYLTAFDSAVEKVVQEIEPLLSSKKRVEKLEAIQKALEDYDFESCLAFFRDWANEEGINLEDSA